MARVPTVSISAVHALITNLVPSIVALSVVTHRSVAASASSSYTRCHHCIVWRWVHSFNGWQSLDSRYAQHWQNGFFDRTSLHSLGLVCTLGHNGDPCPGEPSTCNLTVFDMNGWHKVRVVFCTCDTITPWDQHYRQLLRMRWYPASFTRPRTVFSFDLLETYHKVTLQGKLNLYDFYLAIMQKSDNQGRSTTTVSNLSRWFAPKTANLRLESISRNLTLCSPVAVPQRRQTRGWCTSGTSAF
jgi:hypothetical protein